MNIHFLLTIAAMLSFSLVSAQVQIKGSVVDKKTQTALRGASVYITDLKVGTQTDSAGHFTISNIKKGNYLIEFSLLGYRSQILRINVDKDMEVNAALSVAVAELNNIVVTAVNKGTELLRSPLIIQSFDKNYLTQQTSGNIIDALKTVPGVSQISTGVAISKPVIRGLGYNRVISLHNGIRQEGQQWGDEHGIEIDEYAIDRVEIVKGPGSLLYGSDGIAGVVNFISAKAPSAGQIKTQYSANYQSNNHLIANSIANAGNIKGLQWAGRFTHKMAGNYQNVYDKKVYNSGFRELDGNLFLGVNREWGHTHLHISSFNNLLNLPEGERDSLGQFVFVDRTGLTKTAASSDLEGYQTGYPHQWVNHHRVALNQYILLNKRSLNIDLAWQKNVRREFADVTHPDDVALHFDLQTLNYHFRYHFAEKKGWETTLGLGGMWQRNDNRGLEFLIPAYRLFDAGVYLFSQKRIGEKLNFSGGLRFENRILQNNALWLDSTGTAVAAESPGSEEKFQFLQKHFSGVCGSVGLSWQINETSTMKFNFSRGYRAPTIAELASNGRHEGSFRYEVGNQGLKPEISHQFDVAFFKNSEHISFSFTPFVNWINNFVYVEKMLDSNGQDILFDPSDPAPAFRFVQGNARLTGTEISFDIHPHPLDWLHIENSFSAVRAIQSGQRDSTRNLPLIPAPKYLGEVKAAFAHLTKNINSLFIKAGVEYNFPQNNIYWAYGTETATPGYALFNAGAGIQMNILHSETGLFCFVENLLDTPYQHHLSRLKYAPENTLTGRSGIYNMGRNISLKWIVNL